MSVEGAISASARYILISSLQLAVLRVEAAERLEGRRVGGRERQHPLVGGDRAGPVLQLLFEDLGVAVNQRHHLLGVSREGRLGLVELDQLLPLAGALVQPLQVAHGGEVVVLQLEHALQALDGAGQVAQPVFVDRRHAVERLHLLLAVLRLHQVLLVHRDQVGPAVELLVEAAERLLRRQVAGREQQALVVAGDRLVGAIEPLLQHLARLVDAGGALLRVVERLRLGLVAGEQPGPVLHAVVELAQARQRGGVARHLRSRIAW